MKVEVIEMMIERQMSLDELAQRLGPGVGRKQLEEVRAVLADRWSGRNLSEVPDTVWHWVRTGEGPQPVEVLLPPSATSLMGIYMDLPDQKRERLLAMAKSLTTV